jgi:hypothetical protein
VRFRLSAYPTRRRAPSPHPHEIPIDAEDACNRPRRFEGFVRAELAEAFLGRSELDRAEQQAHAAVTVAERQHCRYDEARANLALAHTQLRRADAAALARAEQALGLPRN